MDGRRDKLRVFSLSFLVFRDDELGQTVTLLTDKSVAARDLKTSNGRLCSVPSFESALLKKQAKLDRALTLSFTLSSLGAIGLMSAFFWATSEAARVEPRSVLVACLLVFFVFFLGTCLFMIYYPSMAFLLPSLHHTPR